MAMHNILYITFNLPSLLSFQVLSFQYLTNSLVNLVDDFSSNSSCNKSKNIATSFSHPALMQSAAQAPIVFVCAEKSFVLVWNSLQVFSAFWIYFFHAFHWYTALLILKLGLLPFLFNKSPRIALWDGTTDLSFLHISSCGRRGLSAAAFEKHP